MSKKVRIIGGRQLDVLTCEFEHISTEALKYLESMGYKVYPSSGKLEIIQNKFIKNQNLKRMVYQ